MKGKLALMAIGALLMGAHRRRVGKLREVHPHETTTPVDPDALREIAPDATERKILDWRVEQLLRVGFEELHAAAIAVSADWRVARDAVEAGCDHRTAMDLVL